MLVMATVLEVGVSHAPRLLQEPTLVLNLATSMCRVKEPVH